MIQRTCSVPGETALDATIWRFRTLNSGQSSRALSRWQKTRSNTATHADAPRALSATSA